MNEENKIKSIECFNKWINKHCKKGMVYRGLQDSEAHLSASLYRRLEISDLPKDTPGFIRATRELIEKATKEGHHLEDGIKMTDLNLLAKLQHMGAATCLIDFTNNPLVALWFACQPITKKKPDEQPDEELDEKPDEKLDIDRKVVALNPENPENPEKFRIIGSKDSENDIEIFLNEGQLWVWPPPKQNSRVIAQQSVFILGQGIIEKNKIDKICIVAKEARKDILEELERHGISENSLFCDFTGFAQQNAWDQNLISLTSHDYIDRAIYAFQSNDRKRAIEYCNIAIEIDSQYERGYYIRGIIKLADTNYDEAITDLDKVIGINPKYGNARYLRGFTKWKKDDYEGAISDLDIAIQLKPQHDKAHYYCGLAKEQKGDYDDAITHLNKTLDINPQYEDANYSRGIIKRKKGDYDNAISDLDIAIQLKPQHDDAYYHRGVAKERKEDYDGAIADLDIAIQINPKHGGAYYCRSHIKRLKENYDGAIADLDKVIQINPQHEDAYYYRGIIKVMKDDDYDGVIPDFDKALQTNPQNEDAYYVRGIAEFQKGNYENAIADCSKAIEINPQHARAHYHRGLINRQLKNHEEAEKGYHKAKELDPNNSNFIPYYKFTFYRYYFKVDDRVVLADITENLNDREKEHQQSRPGWKYGRIIQVGHITIKEAAVEWKEEQRKKGKSVGL